MPLKTYKHHHGHKKHPKHYQKVYWPYLPLILIVAAGIIVGQPLVARSQRGVLAYADNVSRRDLLTATNKQRASRFKPVLRADPLLAKAAQAKAEDMVKRDYWSHQTPDGQEPWVFVQQAGYDYQKAGENLAYGFANSQETVAGWMNSPAHRDNLLDSDYRNVGFGIAQAKNYQNSGPETVIVALYGKPRTSPAEIAITPDMSTAHTVSTASASTTEPQVKSISKAQALTNGHMPWIGLALGILSGASIMYLLLKHGLALRRMLKSSEKYVLQHPLADLTVVSFLALCALLSQSVGLIR